MAKGAHSSDPASRSKAIVGHYIGYSKQGTVLWEKDEFTIGVDKVPASVSAGLGACVVVDSSGELIHKWNPWGVLASNGSVRPAEVPVIEVPAGLTEHD